MIKHISLETKINLMLIEQVHGFWKCEPIQYICEDDAQNKYLLMIAVNELQKYMFKQEVMKYFLYRDEIELIEIIYSGYFEQLPYILYRLPAQYVKVNNLLYQKRNVREVMRQQFTDIVVEAWMGDFPENERSYLREADSLVDLIKNVEDSDCESIQITGKSRNIATVLKDKNTNEMLLFAVDYIYAIEVLKGDNATKIKQCQKSLFTIFDKIISKMSIVEIMEEHSEKLNITPNIHFNMPNHYEGEKIVFSIIEWKNKINIVAVINKRKATIYGFLMPISYKAVKELMQYIFKEYGVFVVYFSYILYDMGISNKMEQAYINLPNNVDELRKRNSSKTRYNIKREKRIVGEKIGKYTIKVYEDYNIPDVVMQKYFEYKKASHGREYGLSPTEYIKLQNVSTAYVMQTEDEVLAMCLSCEKGQEIYFENFSYSPEYKNFSLGSVMYDIYLEKIIEKKAKYVFLGNGHYEYKKKYGSVYVVSYTGRKYRYRLIEKINRFYGLVLTMKNRICHAGE